MDDVSHIALNAATPTKTLNVATDGIVVIAGRRYLTQERLAQILDRSLRTLARWDEQRIGPPKIKVGSKVLYDEAKLPDWLEKNETGPTRERRRKRATL